MRILIIILILSGSLLVACGGSSKDRVLHLATGDYTEAELRAEIRAAGVVESTCASLKGLSTKEILEVSDIQKRDDPTWQARVIQDANRDDDLRQAEIVLEECARIYG